MKNKKYFGQHWLIDENISKSISDKITTLYSKDEALLEIGPGRGAITKYLYKSIDSQNFYLSEIDKDLISNLKNNFPKLIPHIYNKDILKLDLKNIKKKIFLCGNLPYNISNQIFFKIFENSDLIEKGIFMIQKEVGERLLSKPNTKKYGILSVLLQLYYDLKEEIYVPPQSFSPMPKVDSIVISMVRNNRQKLEKGLEKKFVELVKKAFNTRRKKLKNSLQQIDLKETNLENLRAENLSVEDYIKILKGLQS